VRRAAPALHELDLEIVDLGADVLAYHRGDLLVVLNITAAPVTLPEPRVPLACTQRSIEGIVIDAVPPFTAVIARPA
jgi:hypothetical protein